MNINENVHEYELGQNIAQGCLTNSKHPDRFVSGIYPQVVSHGHKEYLYDLYGNKYLDFICGLGTNLFGYGNEKLHNYVSRFSKDGACHSLPSKWEIIAARKVKEILPFVDRVKFVNDGSSACSAAITMARAYQQYYGESRRLMIHSEGYHGWHDNFTALTPPAHGVIKKGYMKPLSEMDHSEPAKIAGIIVEPIQLDDSKARIEYLKELRSFCSAHGIILIFDETITGLRYPKLSVSAAFNIQPDLIIMGKALANGEKIAMVAGNSTITELNYFVSGTYHGHAQTLASVAYCIHMAQHDSNYDLSYLIGEGKWFAASLNALSEPMFRLVGYGSRGAFQGDQEQIALFWQEMAKAGVLFGPSFFLNWDLIPHLKEVLYIAERIINKIKNGEVVLQGNMPTSPFSQKARNQ